MLRFYILVLGCIVYRELGVFEVGLGFKEEKRDLRINKILLWNVGRFVNVMW